MKLIIALAILLTVNDSYAAKLKRNAVLIKKGQDFAKAFNSKKYDEKDQGLVPSTSSGTSAYMMFDYKGEKGAILPENSATVVLGEIFAYQLSRALGFCDIFAEKTLIFVQDAGLDKLQEQIEPMTNHSYAMKRDNAKRVIELIEQARSYKDGMYVAYAPWNLPKALDYNTLVSNNAINFSHPIVKLLQDKSVKKAEVDAKLESEWRKKVGSSVKIDSSIMVRDLSNLLVVDILSNQWDRYSGGNLQVFIDKNKTLRFGAYDNGGTFEDNSKMRASNLAALGRFDKKTAGLVLELEKFLNGQAKSFEGLKSETEFKALVELNVAHRSLRKYYYESTVTNTNDRYYKQFKKSLSILANHIKTTCSKTDCYL